MERMFIDPETGEIHSESYYLRENIDLATVIETVRHGDNELGFVIIPENVNRMRVRNDAVFQIFGEFLENLAMMFSEMPDDEEREQLREVGAFVSHHVMKNVEEMEREKRESGSLH